LPLKIAAKPLQMETWLLLTSLQEVASALSDGTITDFSDLPHDWHTIVRL